MQTMPNQTCRSPFYYCVGKEGALNIFATEGMRTKNTCNTSFVSLEMFTYKKKKQLMSNCSIKKKAVTKKSLIKVNEQYIDTRDY